MDFDSVAAEQIRQQKAKYCRFLDTKQFDAWERLFKPDATIVFFNLDGSVMVEFGSAAEFCGASRELFATTRTIHQTHNSEIDFVSAATARAIWSMEDWHVYAPEGGNASRTMHGYGFYHETWERVDDGWKIARMELHRNIVMTT